jgi:molybdenum cofactor guanylyltransferase
MLTAGFVLVGGQSRRMGRDKALLPWGGGTLAQHIASIAAEAAGTAVLVGDPDRHGGFGYECIPDLRPGLGPLSGIEAALASDHAERNLILACDSPAVPLEHLHALLGADSDCAVTLDDTGRMHPLCAMYRNSCLPVVKSALDEGRLRLLDLVQALNPTLIRHYGVLRNINSMEDWTAVIR